MHATRHHPSSLRFYNSDDYPQLNATMQGGTSVGRALRALHTLVRPLGGLRTVSVPEIQWSAVVKQARTRTCHLHEMGRGLQWLVEHETGCSVVEYAAEYTR